MVRKNSSLSKSKSAFDVDFEVVLIIVLIIVAILLICFINKKFNRESFLSAQIREHLKSQHNKEHALVPEHFTEHSDSEEPEDTGGKHLYLFYATWCGHSRRYLENELPKLESMLEEANLSDKFHSLDVETPEGKEQANNAGVTGLPSVYYHENGKFTKAESSKDLEAHLSWLN